MSAKHKLNGSHVLGTLAVAALMGAVSGSWVVFLVAAVAMVAAAVHAGDIR